ncbi:hypothetical protein NP233_g2362 [Leucocoprinus birnbaumii]|uniref:tRNA (guanine(37)-N1)-methyltransferase n=1 Tax=Leucocoprinus birnbaumii TaxID=56174 RepID=A0AAD5VZ36_9AGAR|nr:hypothetical protein NP233_g2362 [Leucocoprinus birnbaumii]
MSTHAYLDASPPPYNGPTNRLDKSVFRKTLTVLAARVPPSKTGQLLKAQSLKGTLIDLPKVRSVSSNSENPEGDRLVLLRMSRIADIPREAKEYLDKETHGLVDFKIDLDYDHWTADDIMQQVLPPELREGAPTGFAMTGHIAHVNLLDEYLPYKYLIGQLILDKNKKVRTVVNKLNSIDTQFRFFKMEVIAGEQDYIVEHHESDCRFTFDFSKVYWNSRLHTEHERLVQSFGPEEVVADVFAGVGPFAIPAARKGCAVLANDLNPASHEYLEKNVHDNRDRENRRARALQKDANNLTKSDLPSRKRIGHFVMNLPDSAISFLDAFRGILAGEESHGLASTYEVTPMVHCHCFTRELDPQKAAADIRQRVEQQLGCPVDEDVSLHLVRSVAPNKEMYCISFRLPRAYKDNEQKPSITSDDYDRAGSSRRSVKGNQSWLAPLSVYRPLSGLFPHFTYPVYIMASSSPIVPTIHADADSKLSSALRSVRTAVAVPESELKRWRRTFEANAKVVNGEKFLDPESFVNAIAPKGDLTKIDRAQFSVLFRVADTSRRGLVSWEDFTVFETLLKRPDADYWIAFQFFDVDHSGNISFEEFKSVFSANIGPDSIPFDFDCDWVKLYLGKKDGTHVLGYNEFTQLMKGLQGERVRQAFKYLDKDQDGYISPEQFKRIILEIAGHKLSDAVIDRLPTLCTLTPGQRINYSEVIAFHNVLREMDMVERIIREATAKSKDGRIDQTDFLNHSSSNSRYSLFTPMEASIIFHFAGRGIATQRLTLLDFAQLLDPRWKAPHSELETRSPGTATSILNTFLQSAYSFIQGGIAGAFGATIVYPIDMVKTRMQNQRSTVVGQLLYKNSIDCARKILRNEGFLGFYRGLGPQLVGVAPEKAIKLTVNDLIRSRAMDPETGRIKVFWELVAGGMAGGCQVVFTNPLEIVKIRLQVQGEAAKVEGIKPRGAVHIIRQLGILGLYRGASACLLRDIPFSAIYFPAYSHLKTDLFHEGYNGKKLSFTETLAAAAIAGMPAAYLTTPADVVKTRLQVEARQGQTHYKGLRDAFVKIYREEGFRALFKGGPARVIRSSPQFGFTLLGYETLKTLFPYPWQDAPPQVNTALTSRADELAQVRARNALKILLDVHGDFGRRATTSGTPLSLTHPRLSPP